MDCKRRGFEETEYMREGNIDKGMWSCGATRDEKNKK
jgi:hypothetical protein